MKIEKGIYIVTTTPFLKDESIDFDGFAKNIEWLISKKAHGLLVAGALGEYGSMSLEERKSLAEFALKQVKGRVPVIIGTTSHRPQHVIELTNHAYENKAEGVMILPPPGTSLQDHEIFDFYKNICDNSSCPILMYNNPSSSGMDINFELLEKIAKLPNIVAIKESSGDIKRITQIRANLSESINVFCGWEDMSFEALSSGAKGCISMGGNFLPEILNNIYDAITSKDYSTAWKLYQRYLPIAHYLENGGKVTQTSKYFMEKIGLVGGYSRLPKQALTSAEKETIDKLLIDFNNFTL